MKGAPAPHITIEAAGARVRVTANGEVLAASRDALALREGAYPVVYYFPRKDVRMERLARTGHRSFCPFKGHASYWSLKGGAENAVWSYEDPYEDMVAIKERLAFYPDKVGSIEAG
ncbi:MAG TPA: DUF427 domain-containing protein [Burkholderiales bacterium]|nr:DUF427 domain-containing protein [Burkholderiales bacterium]